MAATFIPVSASTNFGLERDSINIPSLKELANALFIRASLGPVIAGYTFTHTTGIDAQTTTKVRMSAFLDSLKGAHHKIWR